MKKSVRHLEYETKFGGERRVVIACNGQMKYPHVLSTNNINNVRCKRCEKTFVYRYLKDKQK